MNLDKKYAADAVAFGSAMNSIAHSQAMVAAVRDYAKELEHNESGQQSGPALNVNELLDDAELQKLHEERIAKLQAEHEKRSVMQRQGHGELQEINEGEFLEIVTKTDRVVCHFFHRDFERCKLMDKHLTVLAKRYFSTRFIKLSATDAPFFTVKLKIKVLPCVICFKQGQVVDSIVGFDGLGTKDDFETTALEDRLYHAEVVEEPEVQAERDDESADATKGHIRKGLHSLQRTGSDEDSDLD
ncbi:uncharacterized protein HaLaN_19104 [Haematococcus lacustris]|uniref:Thioredoxin domain-containing protein n=1 Tax=Haematococcus lacustris TaxID=44745 RepID=A0A699ZZR6_HAELA|nr:hypothetical protein QJQ45_012064 [Haematococcus lacustris]GFH21742.1 uncharacterized protein HaLaN_19104 [Haematococcus lacustris]